jgi:hypothetical protein
MIKSFETHNLVQVSSIIRIYMLRILIQKRDFMHVGPKFLNLYRMNREEIQKFAEEKKIDPLKVFYFLFRII